MATAPTSLRGRSAGFTLLEVLVVVVLLGAATLLVMPSLTSGLGGLQLEAATRDLVTNMKKARTAAVSQQKVHRVILMAPEDPQALSGYVLTNEFEQPLQAVELPRGIGFLDPEVFPLVISFYPNGRCSGGVVGLVSERGKRLFVQVSPITGLGKVVRPSEVSG